MNRFQRIILVVFALAIAAMAAVPPWVFEIPEVKVGDVTFPSRYKFWGYALLFDPPEYEDLINGPPKKSPLANELTGIRAKGAFGQTYLEAFDESARTPHIDMQRLAVQIVGVIALGVAIFFCAIPRKVTMEKLATPSGKAGEITG